MNSSELERRVCNLIQIGAISEVRPEEGLCRVSFGERTSPLSPWLSARAGHDKEFWHPDIGEQAIFFSPYGDGTQGFVLTGMFSNVVPLPEGSRTGMRIVEYGDGTRMEVDRENHVVRIVDSYGSYLLMAGGDIVLQSKHYIHLNPGEGNMAAHMTTMFD